jgi:hypothetical protein
MQLNTDSYKGFVIGMYVCMWHGGMTVIGEIRNSLLYRAFVIFEYVCRMAD